MEGIPVRYKRATAPLDETARARLWGSSGGGGGWFSPAGSADLADLVGSFYDDQEVEEMGEGCGEGGLGSEARWLAGGAWSGGAREMLVDVLAELDGDSVADRIRVEAEGAGRDVGSGADGFKRRVMTRLREKGFDAGLCKSWWEKTSGLPTGSHEYIDVIAGGSTSTRYIVEINLAGEFEIARPTAEYLELLDALPGVFVGRPQALNAVVRAMCAAVKDSLKSIGMHVPPWRRREYVQKKWFGSYKRTTNRTQRVADGDEPGRTAVTGSTTGFAGRKFCRVEIAGTAGARDGKFAVAFRGM